MTERPLGIALTLEERNLLVSVLLTAEELGCDVDLTRPLIEMLDRAINLDDQVVREAFTSRSFFAEAVRVA